MNRNENGTVTIGSPNSIARFITSRSWGTNKFATLERVNGEWVVRAAQTTFRGAYEYCTAGRVIVSIDEVRIIGVEPKSFNQSVNQ